MKEYMDTILSSNNTMTITQIAADYGLSGLRLNKILHDKKFIRNVNGQWLLYSEHMNKGYTKSETIIMKKPYLPSLNKVNMAYLEFIRITYL